jgi:hypothetical protein
VPPLAVSVAEYALLTVAPGIDIVVIAIGAGAGAGAATFTLRVPEPYTPLEFQARIRTLCAPGERGRLVWMLLVWPA